MRADSKSQVDAAINSNAQPELVLLLVEVMWPQNLGYTPLTSFGSKFDDNFHSVYVVKGIWSFLTVLFLNRSANAKI